MAVDYTSGLNFSDPSKGDTDWDTTEQTKSQKLSSHDHTGGGKGLQLSTGSIAANAVDSTLMRLANATSLRGRNAAGAADLNLLKVTSGDKVELPTVTYFSSTETLTTSGAISVAKQLTILNGSSLAMTLAAGDEGQHKWVVNIASTTATVTPGSTSGANTVKLGQYGFVQFVYLGSEWRAVEGSRAIISDDSETFNGAGSWSGFSKLVIATGTTYTITTPNGVEGQTVLLENNASGNVTFGGAVAATGTYYLYSYLNAGWRRVQLS